MKRKNTYLNKKYNFQTGDAILTLLFFASVGFTIWGISIYRQTIIDIKYLVATIAFGILIAFLLLTWLTQSSYSIIWTFLIKAAIGGGLFYFALLFINLQFADKELITEQFQVVKKGTVGGGRTNSCSQPYVNIDFYGTEKQLLFFCNDADAVKHATKVNLTYSKGAFGFNVIQSKQLTD